MTINWTGTGETQLAAGQVDRLPDFDPRTGDHCWVMMAAWKVDPVKLIAQPDGPGLLDTENLLALNGPGCFFCERVYTPRLAERRCKGKP